MTSSKRNRCETMERKEDEQFPERLFAELIGSSHSVHTNTAQRDSRRNDTFQRECCHNSFGSTENHLPHRCTYIEPRSSNHLPFCTNNQYSPTKNLSGCSLEGSRCSCCKHHRCERQSSKRNTFQRSSSSGSKNSIYASTLDNRSKYPGDSITDHISQGEVSLRRSSLKKDKRKSKTFGMQNLAGFDIARDMYEASSPKKSVCKRGYFIQDNMHRYNRSEPYKQPNRSSGNYDYPRRYRRCFSADDEDASARLLETGPGSNQYISPNSGDIKDIMDLRDIREVDYHNARTHQDVQKHFRNSKYIMENHELKHQGLKIYDEDFSEERLKEGLENSSTFVVPHRRCDLNIANGSMPSVFYNRDKAIRIPKQYYSISTTCSSTYFELLEAYEFGKTFGLQKYHIPQPQLTIDSSAGRLGTLRQFSSLPYNANDTHVHMPIPVKPDDADRESDGEYIAPERHGRLRYGEMTMV